MRIGELFAGYGGLGMGVKAAIGGDVAWVSEIDKGACKVLAHRFPDAPNVGDVTEVQWLPRCGEAEEFPGCGRPMPIAKDRRGWVCDRCGRYWGVGVGRVYWPHVPEPVEVATAGFPCQDVSPAGKRAGLIAGTRTGLWHEVVRFVAETRPPLLILENVRGLLSARGDESEELDAAERKVDRIDQTIEALHDMRQRAHTRGDHDAQTRLDAKTVRLLALRDRAVVARRRAERRVVRAIGTVVGTLADVGYDAAWCGLRAADVDGCHGRFRVFVAAHPAGHPWRLDSGDGGAAPVASDVGHERGWQARRRGPGPTDGRLLPTPQVADADGGHASRSGNRSGELLLPGVAVRLLPTPTTEPQTGNGHARNLGGEARLLPTPMVGSTSPAAHGQVSGQWREAMADALANWGDYADAIARWEYVLGRPAPSPTETSPKTGRPRLSPRFEEWMMGLPDGWITDTPDVTWQEAVRMCGNGVVPQQAEAAVRWLLTLDHLAREAS